MYARWSKSAVRVSARKRLIPYGRLMTQYTIDPFCRGHGSRGYIFSFIVSSGFNALHQAFRTKDMCHHPKEKGTMIPKAISNS